MRRQVWLFLPTASQVVVQLLRVSAGAFAQGLVFGAGFRETQGHHSLGDDGRGDGAEPDGPQ